MLNILINRVYFYFSCWPSSIELTVICRGKQWNLTKCYPEFTEFFHGKLWSLVIIPAYLYISIDIKHHCEMPYYSLKSCTGFDSRMEV